MKTSIVIPSWQGKHLLKNNLPKVLEIGADEIIIIENGSTDGSLEFLQEEYPEVKLVINPTNLGFARAVNQGFKKAFGDVVVLLNTDVTPTKNILTSFLPHFKDDQVFAVSFNEEKWSWAKGYFKNGLIEHGPGKKADAAHISFWASGGSAAFDRKKWLELGGFSLIYEPFYWEDIDISYRAQKKGWKVLWEPRAKVEHKHEVTVNKHSQGSKKDLIAQRNQILFFWCNITSAKMWLLHIFWMTIKLLRFSAWKPFLWALLKVPQVLAIRLKNGRSTLSDDEIFAKFND